MKSDVPIPTSATTRNFMLFILFLAIGFTLALCHASSWIVIPVFGISGGFLLMMVMCILDIQEFKMKQNQKLIELLVKMANK